MTELRATLVQLTSSDDPSENLPMAAAMIADAAAGGAHLVLTPEVTNMVSASRTLQRERLREEGDDPTLAGLRGAAAKYGVWLSVGSLALKAGGGDERFVNRSFLIAPDGAIRARYDKIHMFDVEISPEETYRESAAYRPGDHAVVVATSLGRIGLTVCYDLRFPTLYQSLARAGAEIVLVPSAFAVATGRAHWETLLRARAIETGAFVLAAAQCGRHRASRGRDRETWGHSLAVSPWGDMLLDAGTAPGIHPVALDLAEVERARGRVPSLAHDRPFALP